MKQKIKKLLKSPLFYIVAAIAIYFIFVKKALGGIFSTVLNYEDKSVTIPVAQIDEILGKNPMFEANLAKWRNLTFFKPEVGQYYRVYNAWYTATNTPNFKVIDASTQKAEFQSWQTIMAKGSAAITSRAVDCNNGFWLWNMNNQWKQDLGVPFYLSAFAFCKQADLDIMFTHFQKLDKFIEAGWNK